MPWGVWQGTILKVDYTLLVTDVLQVTVGKEHWIYCSNYMDKEVNE